MKALVVEDDPAIQKILHLVLTRMGKCEVLIAADGLEGWRMLQEAKPDFVLLDLMLPGIDGFEVCRRAKADAATKEIPIIFMTAQAQLVNSARAAELGAAAYLIKPFDPMRIVGQINEALASTPVAQLG